LIFMAVGARDPVVPLIAVLETATQVLFVIVRFIMYLAPLAALQRELTALAADAACTGF
jgi:hypothetical protein